jgi:YVTN family beta-propeller protein
MLRSLRPALPRIAVATVCLAAPLVAQQPTICNQPARDAITHVAVPGNPFAPIATPDGCWIFVTVSSPQQGGQSGVVVLRRSAGTVTVVRTIPLRSGPSGAVLTHDGTMLIVAAGPVLAFLDVAQMTSGGEGAVMGYIDAGGPVGFNYVNVTRDDKVLFATEERAATIVVIDLAKVRGAVFDTAAFIGRIPTGNAPIALAFSPGEQYLYTTEQAAPRALDWPVACKPEGQPAAAPNHAQGAVLVIDVARARTDAAHSVLARVRAGCNPVRLVTSPSGAYAYVTARGENSLLVFDANKLVTDSANALVARVPVGQSPVGVAVIENGKTIVLANSNRFAGGPNDTQPLTVVDSTRVKSGAAAVIGTIPAGAFPRELRVTADGKTLLVTNFNSKTLELVDLARLPLQAAR